MFTGSKNQIANVNNIHQGDAKRVLCVCSAGLLRSPTTANILHKHYGYNTRSAGVSDFALIPVTDALILWADEIVVMEKLHKYLLLDVINTMFETPEYYELNKNDYDTIVSKIHVLNVPDNFKYMDDKLQEIILEKYETIKNA